MAARSRLLSPLITGIICLGVYSLSIFALALLVESEGYWAQLFSDQQARRGFIYYSGAYVFPSLLFIVAGRWAPVSRKGLITRQILISAAILGLLLVGFFIVEFGTYWEWKRST